MEFQSVKGTRDFYPQAMRLRNWICDAWRRVSLCHDFEEYDAPIFEYLDLFTIKSGQEIASQLFSLTDRGGRNLAIRPEMTPSLARMVNARINSLPRPIKWFSIARCCRAERPQKGRSREFFQWNIDIIGDDDVLADAECIFVAVDFLREVGLTDEDVCVRIGSRPLTMAAIAAAGAGEADTDKVLTVLDKRAKLPDTDFRKLCADIGLGDTQIDRLRRFQDCRSVEEIRGNLPDDCEAARGHLSDLEALWRYLEVWGVADYCRLDMGIVRGLAYYTGIVYEVFDASGSLRAIGGGGRYDNLLEALGGPAMGATGFGMGDVVLSILLEEKGKMPDLDKRLDFFVIDAGGGLSETVMTVVGALRRNGLSAGFNNKPQTIGKQLKQANRRGARKAVLVRADRVAVKDLASGDQIDLSLEEFLQDPATA